MASGSFQSYSEPYSDRTGGGGMTGTGAPSQPKKGTAEYTNWDYVTANDPARQQQYKVESGARSAQYGTGLLPYYGQPNQAQGGVNTGLYGINSLVAGMYGPQQQILADQLARQQDQLGMVGMDTNYKMDALRRDNGLALQLLGLDRQGLGLDRTLAQGQLGNLGKLRAILDQRRGIAGETKDVTLRGLQYNENEARDMAGRKTFDLRSDLTARGAFNTVANERGTGRISRDLMYQLGGIGVARDQADISYRNTLLGLDEQGISYDNQQLALNHKLSSIGLDYQRLGISEQQLNNALADGLHNTGLAGMVNINQILDAMGGTNTAQAGLANEMLQAILGYSSLPPDVLMQIQKSMLPSYGTPSTPTQTVNTGSGVRRQ